MNIWIILLLIYLSFGLFTGIYCFIESVIIKKEPASIFDILGYFFLFTIMGIFAFILRFQEIIYLSLKPIFDFLNKPIINKRLDKKDSKK